MMMSRLAVAHVSVLPEADRLRLVLFSGRMFDCDIEHFHLFKVRRNNIEACIQLPKGDVVRVMFDLGATNTPDLLDLNTLTALAHPKVHRIAFRD